jgi:hypothetical protein
MFALVLTLMLLSIACFAQAESAASTYDLCTISGKATITLTTDYAPLYISQEADQALMNDLGFARVYISTDDLAPCVLSIAKSELADGMSLTEMGQEGVDRLVEMVSEQFENPEIKTGKIGDRTFIAMMVYGDDGDAHSVFTIDHGYFVQLDQYNEDFSDMDSADGDFAKAILAGLGVKPVQ